MTPVAPASALPAGGTHLREQDPQPGPPTSQASSQRAASPGRTLLEAGLVAPARPRHPFAAHQPGRGRSQGLGGVGA